MFCESLTDALSRKNTQKCKEISFVGSKVCAFPVCWGGYQGLCCVLFFYRGVVPLGRVRRHLVQQQNSNKTGEPRTPMECLFHTSSVVSAASLFVAKELSSPAPKKHPTKENKNNTWYRYQLFSTGSTHN